MQYVIEYVYVLCPAARQVSLSKKKEQKNFPVRMCFLSLFVVRPNTSPYITCSLQNIKISATRDLVTLYMR